MNLIRDLTVRVRRPSVVGQVTRVWDESSNGCDGLDLRVLIQDESGDSIEIRAFGAVGGRLASKFRQYRWYSISRFLVVPIETKVESTVCPLTATPRRIFLTHETVVRTLYKSMEYNDYFSPFGDIPDSMVANESKYVHLMGCVTDVGVYDGQTIDFFIEDIEGNMFKCFAKPGTCVIQLWHVREALKKMSLFVS